MFNNTEIIYRLMIIPGILLGFVLHEFSHALAADKLGDPTPRSQGRITLDPKAHIDILGFILMLVAKFGWAKPVMTNPRNYRKPRRDDIIVSLAGPCSNLVLAGVFLAIMKILFLSGVTTAYSFIMSLSQFYSTGAIDVSQPINIVVLILYFSANINVVLFVLNLLPLPMLDGYHVITNLFNIWKYRIFAILEQYGMFIFILLAISGVLGVIIDPIINQIFYLLQKVFLGFII